MPHPTAITWKFSIPIPHWILAFLYIEGGLIIKFKVTISAHQTTDFYNTWILFPHHGEESRIVLGYLWPNCFYQEEIIYASSRVSLSTGVIASEYPTHLNTPPLPSPPEILPQVELLVSPNHFTSGLQIPSDSPSLSRLTNFNQPPFAADLTVDQVLAQIRSGVNPDLLTFQEDNIT